MEFSEKGLKSQMKRANKLGSRYALIIGDKELREQKAPLREMEGGEQQEVSLASPADLAALLQNGHNRD